MARAASIFHTFDDAPPDLVDLGIPAVTRHIGGMFPGNLIGIGMGQNVGKSSLILAMALASPHKVGVVEMEDGPDVWGARLIAAKTGIRPTALRKREHSDADLDALEDLLDAPADPARPDNPYIEYAISGSVGAMREAVERCIDAGCRIVVLNYLQKVAGTGRAQDRRGEVREVLVAFQQACAPREPDEASDDPGSPGAVPVIASQLTRIHPTKEPWPSHMKESGDIEAECRMIIMGWRDPGDPMILRCKVAKSSFGGGGLQFAYRYNRAETLVPYDAEDDDAEEEADDDVEF